MTTPTDATAALLAAIESGEPVGWVITDPDGNVVDSGPVSFAHMTSELAEQFGLDPVTEN